MKVDLPDAAATEALGAALAAALPPDFTGWTILLEGELGSGKTTLARALLRALGQGGPVPSPTYTLVEPYDLSRGRVYHIDLYRIGGDDELTYLGWDAFGDGLKLVEWPQRATRTGQESDISVRLEYADPGRRATVTPTSARARARLPVRLGTTGQTGFIN